MKPRTPLLSGLRTQEAHIESPTRDAVQFVYVRAIVEQFLVSAKSNAGSIFLSRVICGAQAKLYYKNIVMMIITKLVYNINVLSTVTLTDEGLIDYLCICFNAIKGPHGPQSGECKVR